MRLRTWDQECKGLFPTGEKPRGTLGGENYENGGSYLAAKLDTLEYVEKTGRLKFFRLRKAGYR